MQHFDADAYLQALEPPTFTVGGQQHTGRILSFEEWAQLEGRLDRLRRGELSPIHTQLLIRDLAEAIFPRERRTLWQWVCRVPRAVSVARELARLPMPVQLKALAGFIASQVSGLRQSNMPAPGTEAAE